MDLAKGDFADGSELLHQPSRIVPALLDNSDQAQRIKGAERMSRSLGFDLVLSRGGVRIGGRGFDDLVIGQDVGLDDLRENFGIQSAEEWGDLIEERFNPLCSGRVDRVADFLLSSPLDANQADL